MLIQLHKLLNSFAGQYEQRQRNSHEAYLSQSTDFSDMERRSRAFEAGRRSGKHNLALFRSLGMNH